MLVCDVRNRQGGNLAIRGVAMALFARAYCRCVQHNISYVEMAERLGMLDWHLLTCEVDQIPEDRHTGYYDVLMNVTQEIWRPLVIVGPNRYRITSSTNEVEKCWELLINELYPRSAPALAAAAE